VLTICIIALGLTALLGILTSIEALKSSINQNFATLGANSFSIRNEGQLDGGPDGGDREPNPPITRRQSEIFKQRYEFPSVVSISYIPFSGWAQLRAGDKETNPNVTVMAADENYMAVAGYEMQSGRWFLQGEVESATRNVILGVDVLNKLFGEQTDPLGKVVSIQNQSFRVVGVIKSKGSSMMASDNQVFIPVTTSRSLFPGNESSYTITVGVATVEDLEPAIGAATGLMRQVRRLDVRESNDFSTFKSDSIIELVLSNISYVTLGAVIIGLITLLGAAIGLMNIMLVQVNERTREIGISMALGATGTVIKRQFLTEAIVICLIGGALGILLGVLAGNGVASFFNVTFFIPWPWVFGGIALTFVTGLAAGYYPALKASKLDPIEALRYE
jgi:putative ABC transport system permease protein